MIAVDPRGYAAGSPPQEIDFAYFDEAYFYGNGYRDYDRETPPYKLEFQSRLIERAVRNVDRPRVLDVGCAFGRLLAGLPPYFDRVGTEVSGYALEEARRFVPGVRFVRTDLPPKALGVFDAISAFDVLDQVADPRAMLKRLANLMSDDGTFVAVVPAYDGALGWAQRLLNDRAPRLHRLARTDWLALVSESFDVVEWRGVFRYLSPFGFYVHAPSRPFRGSAPAIVIRAKKKLVV